MSARDRITAMLVMAFDSVALFRNACEATIAAQKEARAYWHVAKHELIRTEKVRRAAINSSQYAVATNGALHTQLLKTQLRALGETPVPRAAPGLWCTTKGCTNPGAVHFAQEDGGVLTTCEECAGEAKGAS